MTSKYPFDVRWDGKLKRYIARSKRLPDRVVMAETRYLAIKEMERVLAESEGPKGLLTIRDGDDITWPELGKKCSSLKELTETTGPAYYVQRKAQ
jgi:hypothetical protein